MIRRILGFALYYGLGVGSAVLAMVLVLPPMKYGSATATADGVQHAVLVEGAQGCPALAGATAASRCPYLAAVAAESHCPYLAAVAAGSQCPYLRGVGGGGCPYLNSLPEPGDSDVAPRSERPDDQDRTAPTYSDPEVNWMPDDTVLARVDAARPAPTASNRS